MKLLSSLSTQDKIKLAAELDGYKDCTQSNSPHGFWWGIAPKTGYQVQLPLYHVSYDAIIPLVQKLWVADICLSGDFTSALKQVRGWRTIFLIEMMTASPSELLDALLIATKRAVL